MNLPDKDILADFNIGQKRMLICQEWERLRGEFLNDAKTQLGTYIYEPSEPLVCSSSQN